MSHRREFLRSAAAMALGAVRVDEVLAQERNGTLSDQGTREELVFVRSADGIVLTGLHVTPNRPASRRVAVIWIHGASENFYFRSYVGVARATAARGHAFLSANTRMHDIGSVLSYHPRAFRGGAYWGLPSKEPLDVSAWVQYLSARGYPEVVLVGHSAGGAAVRRYQAERDDSRVVGLVMASVALAPSPPRADPERLRVAREMVAAGRGDDLLPNLRLSAATYVDYADTPRELWDFYGTETPAPALSRIHCPLLAWFGSREAEIGSAADLERLRELVARHLGRSAPFETRILRDADHEYIGQENQVAQVLADWIVRLPAARRR